MAASTRVISPTIKDQVYAILKAEICGGHFNDGQRLHENELATRLKVSRSPVREALRQLASDGLVLEIPNKGVFVRELTPKDVDEIFEVRLLLESYGMRRSAGMVSPALALRLRECHDDLVRFHRADDLTRYMEADGRLHNLLIRIGHNDLVISVYEKISSLTHKFRAISLLGKERFDESVGEHCAIIECILADDPDAAVAINERHLGRAKMKIIDHLMDRAC